MKRVLICLAAASAAHGFVEAPVNERKPLEVTLSLSSHNRIAVLNSSVEKVYGDNSLFSVLFDKATGQALVHVLQELEEPATLTVVTGSGSVQDLSVRSFYGPSETVRLVESCTDAKLLASETTPAPAIRILNQILDGTVPEGFRDAPKGKLPMLALPKPLEAEELKTIEGPFEFISLYELHNPSKQEMALSPGEVKDVQWAFLTSHKLKKGGQVLCIVGRAKE